MKQAFPDLYGNKALFARLRDDVLARKLSHAYILEGARGSGRHSIALRLAAALSCEKKEDPNQPIPCMHCAHCEKILGGFSPDIIRVCRESGKASIGVDVARKIRSSISFPPNESENKIYIIEDADTMTPQAQNALLLSLESPPPYVLFLLLCETHETLLTTVRSRAPILRTEPLDDATVKEALLRLDKTAADLAKTEPQALAERVRAANGSIGQALELLDAKVSAQILDRREFAREFTAACIHPKSKRDAIAFIEPLYAEKRKKATKKKPDKKSATPPAENAEETPDVKEPSKLFSGKREDVIARLQDVTLALRDLIAVKKSDSAPLCFYTDRETAQTLAACTTIPALLRLYNAVSETCRLLDRNANTRLAVLNLALQTKLL